MTTQLIQLQPENIRQVLSTEEMQTLQVLIDKLLVNNIKLEISYSEIKTTFPSEQEFHESFDRHPKINPDYFLQSLLSLLKKSQEEIAYIQRTYLTQENEKQDT